MSEGVVGAIALTLFAVQIACVVLCFAKGRWILGVLGLMFAPLAWVGALLPAKS